MTSPSVRGIAVVLASLLAAAPVSAAEPNAKLKALVEAANAEGTLVVSWGGGVFGGAKGVEMLQAGMAKDWGAKVNIKYVPGADPARIGSQLATEFKAGQKASVDIFFGAAAQMTPLIALDFFEQMDWAALEPERFPRGTTEFDNRIVAVVVALSGATYNTRLAPATPKSMADFLLPGWKGKIASTPYAASFDTLMSDDLWGVEKTLDYVRALSKQIAGLIRCGEEERVASGEYLALVMDCTADGAYRMKARGAPLDQFMPLEAAQARYYYFAVPKHASHPNAAKLLTAYVRSENGQKISWDMWNMDLHTLPGSRTAPRVAEILRQGGKLKNATAEWYIAHPEIDRAKGEMIKILTAKN